MLWQRPDQWRAPLIVFVASAAIFLASAWRLVPGPVYPGGDEPHYLVITQSLLLDHDLAIENNHARGDYRAYYASPLKPDYRVTGLNRTIYSIHPIGISVIVAPAFAIAGYRGALVLVALLAARRGGAAVAMAPRRHRFERRGNGRLAGRRDAARRSCCTASRSIPSAPQRWPSWSPWRWGWSKPSPTSLRDSGRWRSARCRG